MATTKAALHQSEQTSGNSAINDSAIAPTSWLKVPDESTLPLEVQQLFQE